MRQRMQLVFQILLVLLAALLGIVTNYATNTADVPWLLRIIQQASVPAVGLLIIGMIVAHIVVHRLENPRLPEANWPRDRVPYPGLDAFSEDEAAVYFGREAQAAEVTRRLTVGPGADGPAARFVVLVGASGSGKSSLVKAGVLPRLRGHRWTILPVFSPGANPLGALAAAVAGAQGGREPTAAVLRRLRQGTLPAELTRLRGGRFRRLLIVVDQLEEILTLAGERERDHFLGGLQDCLRADSSVRVLATLRVDFLGQLLATAPAGIAHHPVALGALGRAELVRAVERPGALAGLSFEPGVVDTLLGDAGTDDTLPLLAYLLQEMYFSAGPGGTVTQRLYRELGGVAGALSRQADQTVAELAPAEGIDAVLRVLLKFVTVHGQEVARRRVPLAGLTGRERRIVDAFVDARLLVSDVRDGDVAGSAEPHAQVTHEALFRQWAPLRQEVGVRAEQLRRRAELERWADDWERSGRGDDYLLTGERLALAGRRLEALEESGQASEPIRSLVQSSQHRDLAFLLRVSDSVGRYALDSARSHPERAILLSLAALGDCAPTAAAHRGLMTALAFSHLRIAMTEHTDTVRHIAWSPDGRRLATASRDGSARVHDADSGRSLVVCPGGGVMVESVTWSPDSARIATAGREQVVRLWNAGTGEPVGLLAGSSDICRQVAWSPDGTRIAAGCRDGTVRVWSADTGDLVHELAGHQDDVWGVAWSSDGASLASASHDRTAIVWDPAAGTPVQVLGGHSDFVEGVAWSPDGRAVATGSGDHTVRVWDAATGTQLLLVRGHTDYVWNVAWSPDGRMLASASSDRTVRIVDSRNAEVLSVLHGHTDTVWGVAWSPSGDRLATGSTDGTAVVWDLLPRGAEDLLVAGHRGPVNQALWSPDESRIATASDDGTVRIWDARNGRQDGPGVVLGHRVHSVAFDPVGAQLAISADDGGHRILDASLAPVRTCPGQIVESCAWAPAGDRLATGGHDGEITVLDAATGTELVRLTGHQDWVGRIAWSPGGRMLASSSDDRTCRLWDVAEGRGLTVLRGHDNYVDDVAWSPDEERVATASGDWTAAVWEVSTGRRVDVLKGHEGRVRAVAWSPDGTRIATGSDDGTVRLWSARTFDQTIVAGVHRSKVTSVAWSRDGTKLLTASADGTARVWPAGPDAVRLEAQARARVSRTLTAAEREHHLLPPAGP
ncbi:WD40 repeat domain-containing protein [Streptomyces tsukubensis]|uniref:nSTAND1 domain-containing NTPase n=1 Tax=Streptomyces tsukubensis TaxID=83656 RepID=UPI0036A26482